MKNIHVSKYFFYLLWLGAGMLGCSSDEEPLPDPRYSGFGLVIKNGESITIEAIIKNDDRDNLLNLSIEGLLLGPAGILTEVISVRNLKPVIGLEQKVVPRNFQIEDQGITNGWYLTEGDDVIGDTYKIDENRHNYIKFENYDPNNGTVEGTFQVYLLLEEDGNLDPAPAIDSISFVEGHFNSLVNKKWFE